MTSNEQTGRTVEEATELALQALGVTEDEVDIEILEEGTRGFLGLGQSPARVRVTLKPQARLQEAAGQAPPTKPRRAGRPAARKPAPKQEAPPPAPEPEQPAGPPPQEVVQTAAEIALDVLQHILDGIGDGAKASVRSTDEQLVLDISGGDPGMLIGKHGQTIDAMQYLVGVITNKRLSEKVRIVVDAQGYRARREDALRNQAHFLANKVKETGQEAVLEALHAGERRIIHLALVDDPDVYTYSEGQDPDRRVVISPKK